MENRFQGIFIIEENGEEEGDEDSEDKQSSKKTLLQWKEDEKETFIELFKKHGRDWTTIAEGLPRKTDKQCRNYFQNYKHKLNLL